jgi:AhpC/TSA family protein
MRRWTRAALAAFAVGAAVITGVAMGEDERKSPEVGREAPDFRLNDHEGRLVQLSQLRAKGWTVLAFFPKAMTPG